MNTTELDEVARYAAAVRAALDDLPEHERDDLLEDLEDHLREVDADTEGSLTDRLGPPTRYAEELRASAGLSVSGGRPRRAHRWQGLARARRFWQTVRSHRTVRATVDLVPELRPAWWLVRAYVVVQLLSWLIYAKTDALIPIQFGSKVVGVAVLLLACVASVRLGRRAVDVGRSDPRYVIANTLLALAAIAFAVQLAEIDDDPGYAESYELVGDGLRNGTLVTNIIPVDSDGRLLTEVHLYDQDGQPLIQSQWDGPFHANEYCAMRDFRYIPGRMNVYPHDLADAFGTWIPYQLPPALALRDDRPDPRPPSCELTVPSAAPWER
ncbi:MAG: hypothetical protein L0Y54_06430 [Sporichthyaceae bacterium]|nr:hypothetical protein [Sporichthyaceae bacterium]